VYAHTDLAVSRRLRIETDIKSAEAKSIGVDKLELSWRKAGHAMIHVKVHGSSRSTPITIAWDKCAKVHLGSHCGVDIEGCI
jgi:hypothetical protein